MGKKKIRVLVILTFAVALIASAILSERTICPELALLQDAMRELRRTDNLEFSYENTISAEGVIKSERVVVWANQLTGSWVSEHYTTDEDGTRLYLRQFCDGLHIYNYIDWSGEWELEQTKDTDIPYLDRVIDLPYDSEDITDIRLVQKVDVLELSYKFTPEYVDGQNRKRQQTLEDNYEDYLKMQTSDEGLKKVELAMEQYRQTREENTSVVYRIDSAGVMRGLSCEMILVSPEVVYRANGEQELGEERRSSYEIEIEINRYNQAGVLNKIAQCSNEVSYFQEDDY